MKIEFTEQEAESYLESLAKEEVLPADLGDAYIAQYGNGSYWAHIKSVHKAIWRFSRSYADKNRLTFGDGLLETAKKYCRSPLMVVTMLEWYCCYTPKKNKDTTPEIVKYEEEVASPALEKILDEKIKEIGRDRFAKLADDLNVATNSFKAFSKGN